MPYKKYKGYLGILILLLSTVLYGQDVLQLVPSDGTAATELVAQIMADTTANGGIPDGRIYELQSGQIYLATQTFYVEAEYKLNMRASGDEHAIIYLYPTGTGTSPQNPPGYFIRTRGGDLQMDGIALSGYFEPVDSNFNNVQGGLLRTDGEGASLTINNCIFSNISGQVLRTNASTQKVMFTNCIMTNLGSLGGSNLGAGKGIDLRDVSCDSLILVNNTFTNYQDRVVRHYNFGNPLAGTGDLNYCLIDHNTFYSGMGFHGMLSLGNVGDEVIITNNLMVDAFSAGEDSTDITRTAEWGNNGEFYANGNSRMSWIFTAPNEVTNWVVNNNFYAISDEGQAFFDAHTAEPITEGSPLSWHINGRLGADSASAFVKIDDPQFTATQDLILNIMNFYVDPAGGNKTKETGAWVREEDDMDRRPLAFWMDTFDVSYSIESAAYSGAEMGYPAGNLNAFPDLMTQWAEGVNLNSWLVYDGSMLPAATEGAGSGLIDISKRSDDSPGAGLIEEIIDDDAISGNKILKYLHPDGKLTHQYVFDDNYVGTAFTMLARIKGENDAAYDRAFDIRWDNGNFGFRDELRIWPADSTIELEKVDVKVVVDMDLYDWHTYRITMDGDYCKVYVDENPVAVVEGTTTSTSSNKYIKLGDGSGDAIGGYLDWFILDVTGAYGPGEGLDIPSALYVDDSSTDIGDEGNEVPTQYSLGQNYPNPFNPTTTISYTLPERAVVSLVVFNSLGQEITRLVDNMEVSAGVHDLKWNAKDNNGHRVASGIYFYQLRSNDIVQTKKMLLLK